MRVFFSGIGGTGIGPLALIAKQAGYDVVGSDKQASRYTSYLKSQGINLYIGQTAELFKATYARNKIDWYVYSSAVEIENPEHPELKEATRLGIKTSKRDGFLSFFLDSHNLKLLAFAGTHGKTTSTAMAVWTMKKLGLDPSYSVGAKLDFGSMGEYRKESPYFVYECDEFDRNFLSYKPYASVLSKVDWDHHEQYPTRQSYIEAFQEFCGKSKHVIAHVSEISYLSIGEAKSTILIPPSLETTIKLTGLHNRMNASGVVQMLNSCLGIPLGDSVAAINEYPGSSRRFERISPGIYSDYAHTPEEISATIQLAKELTDSLVVVYEPLTDRRQHYMKELYANVFNGIEKLYWLPSYLAREDPNQSVIPPSELVKVIGSGVEAEVAQKDDSLARKIRHHLEDGSTIVLLAGGGGGSLDEWARETFALKP